MENVIFEMIFFGRVFKVVRISPVILQTTFENINGELVESLTIFSVIPQIMPQTTSFEKRNVIQTVLKEIFYIGQFQAKNFQPKINNFKIFVKLDQLLNL